MTTFKVGDVVELTSRWNTQGLQPGKKYTVARVSVSAFAFGDFFVTYYVVDGDGVEHVVTNGHLVLKRCD